MMQRIMVSSPSPLIKITTTNIITVVVAHQYHVEWGGGGRPQPGRVPVFPTHSRSPWHSRPCCCTLSCQSSCQEAADKKWANFRHAQVRFCGRLPCPWLSHPFSFSDTRSTPQEAAKRRKACTCILRVFSAPSVMMKVLGNGKGEMVAKLNMS